MAETCCSRCMHSVQSVAFARITKTDTSGAQVQFRTLKLEKYQIHFHAFMKTLTKF